nr:uncharacterized protein LOC120966254 [Aegilops tauschii subsp. strangulata]
MPTHPRPMHGLQDSGVGIEDTPTPTEVGTKEKEGAPIPTEEGTKEKDDPPVIRKVEPTQDPAVTRIGHRESSQGMQMEQLTAGSGAESMQILVEGPTSAPTRHDKEEGRAHSDENHATNACMATYMQNQVLEPAEAMQRSERGVDAEGDNKADLSLALIPVELANDGADAEGMTAQEAVAYSKLKSFYANIIKKLPRHCSRKCRCRSYVLKLNLSPRRGLREPPRSWHLRSDQKTARRKMCCYMLWEWYQTTWRWMMEWCMSLRLSSIPLYVSSIAASSLPFLAKLFRRWLSWKLAIRW